MNPQVIQLLARAAGLAQRAAQEKPLHVVQDHIDDALLAIGKAIRAEAGGE